MYALGIDLGTTYTAAATWRDDRVEIASLGSRAAVIPSVVLLRDDETFLTGETASRRALTEPGRVAREFKRRLGDPTPLLLGGVPYAAEGLMARLLRWVVDEVAAREGGEPESICVSHPANWGPYKLDLLQQAVRRANLDQPVSYTSEPAAAATFYAQGRPVPTGSVVAVYDLGGGTFDAAVLRKTETGFELLGQPEGIERLGGIDFDAAVFSHVSQAIGDKLEELDDGDPAALAAVARLREECVEAKEALSTDTDVTIPVLLPNLNTEVRLTRSEFEAMVRPVLHESIEALRRALRSAQVDPEELHAVLLVGGSSRIPLVSQLVGAELGRPVAVDAHPKHAIALGAAWVASGVAPAAVDAGAADLRGEEGLAGESTEESGSSGSVAAAAPWAAAGAALASAQQAHDSAASDSETTAGDAEASTREQESHRAASAAERQSDELPNERTVIMPRALSDGTAPPSEGLASSSRGLAESAGTVSRRKSRSPLLIAGAIVAGVGLGLIGWLLFIRDGSDDDPLADTDQGQEQQQGDEEQSDAQQGDEQQDAENEGDQEQGEDQDAGQEQLPADEQCSDDVLSNDRWVCITSASVTSGELVIEYDAEWAGDEPNASGGFHVHFYGSDESGTNPPEAIMGTHADDRGNWYIEDQNPSVHALDSNQAATIGDSPKVCARIANGSHELIADADGGFNTGNCWPVDRS